MEKISIIIVTRDRFSPTKKCLQLLLENTPQSKEIIVVLGGVPKVFQQELTNQYGDSVTFFFQEHLMNPSELRNIGLRATKTRLSVVMDNDVYVPKDWLAPLIACQIETGAAMVVPIITENGHKVHTAGNNIFITYKNGKAFGSKELCYAKLFFLGDCNLERRAIDYGELHCQLVDTTLALQLNVYDEKYREVAEVDSGMVWHKHGHPMFLEPKSHVYYDYPTKISDPIDIAPFLYKWDMRAILEGYHDFREKWNLDITEGGKFREFLSSIHNIVGFLPRWHPAPWTLAMDQGYRSFRKAIRKPFQWPGQLWRRLRNKKLGTDDWRQTTQKEFGFIID